MARKDTDEYNEDFDNERTHQEIKRLKREKLLWRELAIAANNIVNEYTQNRDPNGWKDFI